MFVDMNQTNTALNGLTVPAAAARVGVEPTAIREAISRGELAAKERFTLVITPTDVDAWMSRRETGADQ